MDGRSLAGRNGQEGTRTQKTVKDLIRHTVAVAVASDFSETVHRRNPRTVRTFAVSSFLPRLFGGRFGCEASLFGHGAVITINPGESKKKGTEYYRPQNTSFSHH
eukprot:scaffold25842_cov198-Amphora_coffeaeformis.AAC.33